MKKIIATTVAILLVILFTISVSASGYKNVPYNTYEYNPYGDSVASPAGYVCLDEITAEEIGLSVDFKDTSDIQIIDNKVYILDSGNSRIVVLNSDYSLYTIYCEFTDKSGKPLSFDGAGGFAIDKNGNIYIADTQNTRVLIFYDDLKLKKIISRPDEALKGYDNPFDVSKVMVDTNNQIYVLADSINLGAMVFSQDGDFLRFFGSNEVQTTGEAIINNIKKRFMTKKQIATMKKYTPISFSNFDIDFDGFVFTVTAATKAGDLPTVRKLNYNGSNILSNDTYGDLEKNPNSVFTNTFKDIEIDNKGFINLLDTTGGKVFQYSQEGQMVSAFGSYGVQNGSFTEPVAIESINDNILVFDKGKNALIVFGATDYAKTFRQAVVNLEHGELNDSLKEWKNILDMNSNSSYANYGMGLVYDKMGKYGKAMHYFKLSGSTSDYSNSFKQYRNEYIHNHPIIVVGVIVLLIACVVVLIKIYGKKLEIVEGTAFSGLETRNGLPLYTLVHPVDGFENFKRRKNMTNILIATAVIVFWFLAETFHSFYMGFSFVDCSATDYNLGVTCVATFACFFVFVVANWSICTLFDGKGTFKEIYCVAGYSMIPYVASRFIITALSNVLVDNEKVFLSVITFIGVLWTAYILVCGLYSIHEFSVLKLLLFIFFTVIAMIIIVFIAIVFYGLLQQTYNFLKSVLFEISLRREIG